MPKKIVMGNWKMNGSIVQIQQLLKNLQELMPEHPSIDCVVLPPTIYLPLVREILADSSLLMGAQNLFPQDSGAYTGEVSGAMLQEYSCRYVLVGHSERRRLFHEDEKFVAEKFHHAKDHDMIPVLCVGETLEEREQGLTEQVLEKQILAITTTNSDCFESCVIAYEPVWAIGTGKTAEPEQVQQIHAFIRRMVATINHNTAKKISILYGGSVNETNAHALFAMPDVDGGLIGGASLNARQFVEIVKCINCA